MRALAPALLSQQAVHRFLGYLHSQRERLLGRGSRHGVPNRPELVERYGYDVKYASHALRLAFQGLEVARDARLTLPMPAAERERVPAVKRGDVPDLAEVVAEIADVEARIERLLAHGDTPLPEHPDLQAVTSWSVPRARRGPG